MRSILFFLLFWVASTLVGQSGLGFQLYDNQGNRVNFSELLEAASVADVVFLGELHNNPISHWLQRELTEALYLQKKERLMLGAEMFETDDQLLLDEYLSGKINQKNFEEEAKLWKNYATDYKPLIEFAKTRSIPFYGTNIPRRYANLVFRSGLEALAGLSSSARNQLLPPLPIPLDLNLPAYQKMVKSMGSHGGNSPENMVKAQAIKDACMGYVISQVWKPGHTLIHLNGSYHSDDREGIVWYLNNYRPGLNILTLTTVEQEYPGKSDETNRNKADFLLVVAETMTKTY